MHTHNVNIYMYNGCVYVCARKLFTYFYLPLMKSTFCFSVACNVMLWTFISRIYPLT